MDSITGVVPGCYQLTRALQTSVVDVILLQVTDSSKARSIYEYLAETVPEIPVITFATNSRAMRSQFALTLPLSVHGLMDTIRAAVHSKAVRRRENVIAMMPAKAGCGATTITINIAARLAGTLQRRVLVCESDLRSGVIAELLGLQTKAPIQETLRSAESAEALIWPRHICNKAGIDFLLTRRTGTQYQPRWHDYFHLLSFAAKRYDNVVFDLPELIDDATAEVVQAASKVYLIATPELLSLDLAHQRLADLREAGVDASNIRVLVNRHHNSEMKAHQIEEILDCPVEMLLPNNYPAVHAATAANTFVDSRTELGRSYQKCAAIIARGNRPEFTKPKGGLFGFLRPARRYEESLAIQRG